MTENELAALRLIANQRGVSMSLVIREALDRFLFANDKTGREVLMSAAFGIWADHAEFDLQATRGEFDRSVDK